MKNTVEQPAAMADRSKGRGSLQETKAKRYHVGIIGCGGIVRNVHLPVLLKLDDVQVGWLADIDETRGRQLSQVSNVKFFNVSAGYTALPQADIILIASPYGARQSAYDYALSISQESRPCFFVEKPFAKSLEEHKSISSAFAEWQVGVNLYWRSLGSVKTVQRLIEERVFGSLREMNVNFGGLGRILTRGGYLANPELSGGGILMEMGVHYIDAALFCVGATDLVLAKGVMKKSGAYDVHTEASFNLSGGHAEGVPLHLCITSVKNVDLGIEMIFDNAVVRFNPGAFGSPIYFGRGMASSFWPLVVPPELGPANVFSLAAEHWRLFLKAVSQRVVTPACATGSSLTSKAIGHLYDIG